MNYRCVPLYAYTILQWYSNYPHFQLIPGEWFWSQITDLDYSIQPGIEMQEADPIFIF